MVDSFSLVEHFDYLTKYIPQPFYIQSDKVICLKRGTVDEDSEYLIETSDGNYTLTKGTLKKLVDNLGIKVKLLSSACEDVDVYDLVMPALNKLFKCYADCFVFYATAEDARCIIDLNINKDAGAEGTRYESGPSPWGVDVSKDPSFFTCFNDFLDRYIISHSDTSVRVKADADFLVGMNVNIHLFKDVGSMRIQPMLSFSGKCTAMGGFTEIHPVLFDTETGISIVFPQNYVKKKDPTFDDLWGSVMHLCNHTDLNDYVFRAINEIAVSDETPSAIKNFISSILTESTLNLNQPTADILSECVSLTREMRSAKANKFKKNLGAVIGYAILSMSLACKDCGHMNFMH